MTDHSANADQARRRPAAMTEEPALLVERPDQLQALGDATRWRILGSLLDGPASIQGLARTLGVAKGTIGHHVAVLDRAGLIRVVDQHRVRGVVEKRYGRVARQFQLPKADSPIGARHPELGLLPLRQALSEARPSAGEGDPSMSIVVRARMPADRARRFAALVTALAAEFADGAPEEGETFGLVASIYVPDWANGGSG
jgi:DNA-binding transcriptional ArsR family regulator